MSAKNEISDLDQSGFPRGEQALGRAVAWVKARLLSKFPGVRLHHERLWLVPAVVESLRATFPAVEFHCSGARTVMQPAGGILSLVQRDGTIRPILIAEYKHQGSDQTSADEQRDSKRSNSIERLGKNVIGFRTALLSEAIFPFVCFGDGRDFAAGSNVLDRVATIAMFGPLNVEHLHNEGRGQFNRGSFYFAEAEWTEEAMFERCHSIAEKSIFYYFSKYGEVTFRTTTS